MSAEDRQVFENDVAVLRSLARATGGVNGEALQRIAARLEAAVERLTMSAEDAARRDLEAFTLARELQMGFVDEGHIAEAVQTIEAQRLEIERLRRYVKHGKLKHGLNDTICAECRRQEGSL